MRSLLAVACAALAVAAGCGGTGSSTQETPASTAPAATTATAPSEAPTAAPLPARPGSIPAGIYETTTFRPSLVLHLPTGFQLRRPEYEDLLSFVGDGGAITILDLDTTQAIDPKGAANPTTSDLGPPPSDLAAWLSTHPSLQVSDRKSVTVAGVPATQLDVHARPGVQDVSLFYTHEILVGQPAGAAARVIFFPRDGHLVTIAILAPESSFESFANTAAQVVSSLAFELHPATAATPVSSAACGDVQTFPSVGRNHVETAPPDSTYNSFPPTSGPHYPTPAAWGVYTKPFAQFVLIHNLEHGGIVVQYGQNVPADTVSAMRAWVNDDPEGMLLAPLPELGGKIAVTAWTHLLTCSQFDEKAFSSFRDAYRYKGPELLSADSYKPSPAV